MRRATTAVAVGVTAGAIAASVAVAAADAQGAGGGAAVYLRLRPHAGDTVRTRFEQAVNFLAREGGAVAMVAPSGAMTVYAHSVVERADAVGAVISAVSDSVTLRASGAPAHATEAARRAMQGRRTRLHIAPDGATTVLRDGGADAVAGPGGDAAMRFPAALPAGAVAPGAMWSRAMEVPWGAGRSAAAGPAARTTIDVWFRFDSLTHGGTLAFLSMRGAVRAPGTADGDAASPGAVAGALVVDLARGWVVDSRATFQLDGALTPPGGQPRRVRVVVTQRLRVL